MRLLTAHKLSSRHAHSLNQVVEAFQCIDRALPRFHHYITKFSSQDICQLKAALVNFFAELIGFFQDSIRFFRRRTISNILRISFTPLRETINTRLQRLRQLTEWVEQEASVACEHAKETKREVQHQELLQRLSAINRFGQELQDTMFLSKLPFQNLPTIQNPAFYGRDLELQRLVQHLHPGNIPKKLLIASLHGLGGGGKTQIALEYAYRFVSSYDAILWVTAESSLKLADSFKSIGQQIGIVDDSNQNTDQVRELLKDWLFKTSKREPPNRAVRWLIIYDNIQDCKILEQYWPRATKGAIIMTSRNPGVARHFANVPARIEVLPFSLHDGENFLLSLLQDNENRCSSEEDRETASKISQAVGNLPLALSLVGSYISSTGMSSKRFLDTNRHFERNFLFNEATRLWDTQSYQNSINTTWIMNTSPPGSKPVLDNDTLSLIQMLAFLDGDGVPLSLFLAKERDDMLYEGPDIPADIPGLESLLQNPFTNISILESSVAALLRVSLINRNREQDRIVCHRLVRIAVAQSMDPERKAEIFNQTVFLLNAEFPQQQDGKPMHENWKTCQELSRQVSSLLETYSWYKDEVGYPILLCEIVTRCAWYLFESGQYNIAFSMAENAIVLCGESLTTSKHPGFSEWYVRDLTSYLYNVQASIMLETVSPDSGLGLHLKIKAIREDNKRPGNPEDLKWLAAADGNIAVSLLAESRPEEAYPILLELLQRKDMETNRDIYMSNICICLIQMQRFDEALVFCFESMATVQQLRGKHSAQMAILHFYLGTIYYQQGKTDQAFEAFQDSFIIRQKVMPHHHYTGFTLYKVGTLMCERSDPKSSIPFFHKSLQILGSSECHPGASCRTAFALSQVYERIGDSKMAARYMKEGKRYRSRIVGPEFFELGISPGEYDRFVGFSHR